MTRDTGAVVRVPAPATATSGYDVVIRPGALSELPGRVAATGAARCVIIADDNVAALHSQRVHSDVRSADMPTDLLTFPAGEAHKTRENWLALCDRMFDLRCGRDTCVVALGGGVTGDLAGFVAATYMRGLPFIQVPTTLLAMIDASVGGKTGVDTPAGKNLVGAFHAPQAVIADTSVLHTLPRAELCAGLAEAVKHGAILDEAYFDWIGTNADVLLAADAAAIETLVRRSVELKAAVVGADPLEHGQRAVLNFGHTIGHALELHSSYGMLHGYAVAIGMTVEALAGELLGTSAPGTRERVEELLRRCELPVAPHASEPGNGLVDDVLAATTLDKKARGARGRFVLLSHIGAVARGQGGAWTHEVPHDILQQALEAVIRPARVV